MDALLKQFSSTVLHPRLALDTKETLFAGVPSSAFSFFLSALSEEIHTKSDRPLLVVTPSNQEAENLAEEAAFYLGEERVAYLPGYEGIPYEYAGLSPDITHQRLRVLSRIRRKEVPLVYTSPEALIRRMPHPESLDHYSLSLRKEMELAPDALMKRLVQMGYNRALRVELPGDFCRKGSIIDLFPVNHTAPLRLDYFDDLVESLRQFDPDTQMTRPDSLEEVVVLPAGEFVLSKEESARLKERLQGKEFASHLERPLWLEAGGEEEELPFSQLQNPGIEELYPLAGKSVRLQDFFPGAPLLVTVNREEIRKREEQIRREFHTMYERESQVRVCLPPEELLVSEPLLAEEGGIVLEDSFGAGAALSHTEELEDDAGSPVRDRRCGLRENRTFGGRIREVREEIKRVALEGGRICITSPYSAQINRIAGIFRTEKEIAVKILDEEERYLRPSFGDGGGTVWVVRSPQRSGFTLPAFGLHLWSDADIFGRSYRKRNRFKSATSAPIESFLDLKENDYVVHVTHGVGRFLGLERVKAAGRERDFLVLEYAEQDRLFVPLDQISMVQKYASPVEKPRLDHLGKASFKKVKERVEQKIEEFAQELIKLYAVRMSEKGFQFPEDTAWQEEFEAEFPYDETPDQISSIEAVKRDMESRLPMDRLICGDVGYGKTEVAIRAAFKSVMSGKQVAVITPTTILAMQHFQNFTERFKNYPIRVDGISRFRTRREVTAIKKDLQAGEVDVVIGTHALLSKEFRIKNLGLLIVDEEQRFGVTHKEAIKNVKKLVDVLTLSATPIPRTLHMSLVGIRDVSIIQTPPRDRLPVRTYAMEDSDTVLCEAIQRETERGGQVFFLHNRVETIDLAAERVRTLMPELSIATLHGQMYEDEIEDTLMDFLHHKYDILVTTSIIESGIDMPNVNTLIVDRADMFGLSQLYQIRGRVGRSNRQAYAYLFYPGGRILTEQAQKRINTILEYQELGSGFKVAMRDLEIRGAGNILGKEQSGDIVDVGYELYIKLLSDAVRRLKGEEVEVEVRCGINLKTDFYIPEDYIPDVRQRIEFYKRFEAARDEGEVEKIATEMADRFGDPPPIAETFIQVEKIRTLSSRLGFESVFEEDTGRIAFKAGEYFRIPPPDLIHILKADRGLYLVPGNKDTLFFDLKGGELQRMKGLVELLLWLHGFLPGAEADEKEETPPAGPGKKKQSKKKRS